MSDPTTWLALSLGLVAVSLTAVFVVALPAVIELGRAARSAEKLFDTLNRELPPVLDAMQTTGQELSELTDGVGESVEKAGRLVQQVDQGVQFVKHQADQARRTGRSVAAGARAAWAVLRDKPTASHGPSHTDLTSHDDMREDTRHDAALETPDALNPDLTPDGGKRHAPADGVDPDAPKADSASPGIPTATSKTDSPRPVHPPHPS